MIYPKILLAQSIIEIFRLKEITNIVISPGSRNAPLTIGFVNNSEFNCYSIVDERCAAFFALGIAQQTKKPVAIICTSGSALLNYYPAIAEAFYSQIPLIVIAADRPKSKIDIGDGQTIRQENVYLNHSLYNANLTENDLDENDKKIQEAINTAILKRGPVHINAPFEEPLYETTNELAVKPTISHNKIAEQEVENYTKFIEIWNNARKKLILVGEMFPKSISDEITNIIATDPSVVVMTENISNWHNKNHITNIEGFLAPLNNDNLEDLRPEILVTFGGMIVSKRIKTMLRKYKPLHHWHIDNLRAYNVFDSLTHHFKINPNDFFKLFLPSTAIVESNYNQLAQNFKEIRINKSVEYLKTIPFTDLKAFEIVMPTLPENTVLQLGNSSTIRYAQLFDIHKTIEVFCNRGTSGIDGSTSTSIGSAVANTKKQTIFITGDISFFYDSNALWNNYIPNNYKVIIINNGGGGIFRILPGHAETEVFNNFFETSHCLTAEHLAKMYGFDYQIANSETNLKMALINFYNLEKKSILEIFTPTKINNKIFDDYFKHLI